MIPGAALEALCRHIRSGIAVFDRDMNYLFANRGWSEHYGLGDRELLGHNHYEICPQVPEEWRAAQLRCLEGAAEQRGRARLVRPDGTIAWVDWEVVAWQTDERGIGGIAILSDVVSEQVHLAAALVEVQRLLAERDQLLEHERAFGRRLDGLRHAALAISMLELRSLSRSSALLQLILDQARTLTCADYGALGVGTVTDRPFEPWLWSGVTEQEAAAIGPHPRPIGLLGQIAREGKTLRLDAITGAEGAVGLPAAHVPIGPLLGVPIRQRDQPVGNLYLAKRPGSSPFSDDDVAILELLAEHAAVAIENARLYDLARDQVRAREEVLAVVSHDLKSPLNAIALREQLLERQHGKVVDSHTAAVSRSINEMRRMVLGLLDVASLDVGNLRLQRDAVDVGALVGEVTENARPLADDRQLTLDVRVAGAGIVSLDRERIWQVLSNLIGNAIKFTPSGGRIQVCARRDETQLSLSVSDTGPGIAPEVLPRVFDRYFTTARGNHGTGLGLYIVKGLVEAHGGSVRVESAAGSGTSFAISLPLG